MSDVNENKDINTEGEASQEEAADPERVVVFEEALEAILFAVLFCVIVFFCLRLYF